MKFIALSNKGLVRENNEDSFIVDEKNLKFFIIADGMGGHKAGEIASQKAVSILKEDLMNTEINSEEDLATILVDSVREANEEIYNMSRENLKYRGMGTTLSLIYIFEDSVFYINVGDSRIYEIDDREIKQITQDDSFVNYLIEIGEISKDEAESHPKKNVLTKALGTSEDLDIEVNKIQFNKENKYLICSDGLSNMISEDRLFSIIKGEKTEEVGEKLIDEALANGGIDNITLILIYS
ncbi:MAG: Stp1/IreP family PP2C-type Ser/Thr phosphatase [Peptoniphilus sp.]|nr:Stp1/IreP family PP2C-type Ser/Thr phosphatase [Peptoniphilus sp.]